MNKAIVLTKQRGSILVVVAVSMTAMLSFGALAVDLAHLYLVKGELQNVADAAALAGASGLVESTGEAIQRARDYAQYNKVARQDFQLAGGDIEFGIWDFDSRSFVLSNVDSNAIRVTARKTQGSPNGEVPLLFAKLFGKEKASVQTQATAVINSRDTMLVLDRSGSMNEGGGFKLQGVKDGANSFVDLSINQPLTEDNVGMVWYDTNASLTSELTDNLAQLHEEIDNVTAAGWTSISGGLDLAIKQLTSNQANPYNKKTIVLLTDGKANTCVPLPEISGWLESPSGHGSGGCCSAGDSNPWDPSSIWVNSRAKREVMYLAAEKAATQEITIYTITIGSPGQMDDALMKAVAEETGGLYFTTDDPNNIINIFEDVAERIQVSLVN